MHLVRCHDQKSKTLDEFYKEISEHDRVDREIGMAMLSLLARLRALPDGRDVWGLTSHYRLCLLATDSSETPWFVTVVALNERNYFLEYLMPERLAPWPHAYVRGEALSEDDAVRMILIGMERSEGWSDKRWGRCRTRRCRQQPPHRSVA
ncbi:MAG: hypothetical protein SFY80_16760 [Verrucomicrobiota bacterium]|nr:hypothetical protein [Verrucomicrobiota bacterium]